MAGLDSSLIIEFDRPPNIIKGEETPWFIKKDECGQDTFFERQARHL